MSGRAHREIESSQEAAENFGTHSRHCRLTLSKATISLSWSWKATLRSFSRKPRRPGTASEAVEIL
jgi:hypothetical protein